jgi:4-amino-4-deoxy-L-arabinose transferase-like glycosyltransferase
MTKITEDAIKTEALKDRSVPRPFSFVTVLGCAWPALLLATVCLLPFLNKPFLIDDPYFLDMAQQVVHHPTHPMDFTICWNTAPDCSKAYALTSGNALIGYALVPTVLTGAHEWTAHLTQLVLVWIAVLAMVSLVLRLGWDRQHAIIGALLLVAIAPFLPMASTAMPDILATTVALVAMERLAAWKAEQKWSQGAAAAIALGLAGFARSQLALLLPLAAFYLLDSVEPKQVLAQLRQRFRLWIPVIAGFVLLFALIAITREHNLALNPPAALSGLQNVRYNLASYLEYLVFPIPLAVCWLANRLRRTPRRAAIILIVAAAAACLIHPRLVSFLALVGLGMMIDLLYEAWDRRDPVGLFLLLWILIPLPIVVYFQLAAKYLLPSMPAVILLCLQLMDGFPARFSRAAAIVVIVASTGYSLLILRADAEFAHFGRDAMYQLIQPRAAAGEKVWFGNQFSAYWYAPAAGATLIVPSGPQPKPGDLLVVGMFEELGLNQVLPRYPQRTLVEAVTHKYRLGRTMGAGAGLYTNRLVHNQPGYWLWGFGDSPDDRYELWRIN